MESEWSSNFVFPLQSMLSNTKNESAVYIRATEICKYVASKYFRSNQMLLECLQDCEESKERSLLTLGLEPWREICANLPGKQIRYHFV
uniref:Uncharacterized protein n=1 Tax=Syphacia muris TaxID=451379 RepID=A0A0N5ABG8_9BILA